MSASDAPLRLQRLPRRVLNAQTMRATEPDVLCAFRGLSFFASRSWPALSAASRAMHGEAACSRWERPFAMILGCLDIFVARSTRCVHRLWRALPSPSPRELSPPATLGFSFQKCQNRSSNQPTCTEMLERRLVFIAHTTFTLP